MHTIRLKSVNTRHLFLLLVPTHISMLRGVNVAGRKVDMAQLREIYSSSGAMNVRTYIQSGNVIFESGEPGLAAIEKRALALIRERFNIDVRIITRSPGQFRQTIEEMPFRDIDEGKLHVTFLSSFPGGMNDSEFEKARDAAEKFSFGGSEIYLYCPNGYGRTRLTNDFIERKLGVSATTRNWRTVNALLSVAETGN